GDKITIPPPEQAPTDKPKIEIKGNTKLFDGKGNLTSVEDTNGNAYYKEGDKWYYRNGSTNEVEERPDIKDIKAAGDDLVVDTKEGLTVTYHPDHTREVDDGRTTKKFDSDGSLRYFYDNKGHHGYSKEDGKWYEYNSDTGESEPREDIKDVTDNDD